MKLTPILLLILLASCAKSKSGEVCWKCTFSMVNGVQPPDTTICNDGSAPKPRTTDQYGNDYGYYCTKR